MQFVLPIGPPAPWGIGKAAHNQRKIHCISRSTQSEFKTSNYCNKEHGPAFLPPPMMLVCSSAKYTWNTRCCSSTNRQHIATIAKK